MRYAPAMERHDVLLVEDDPATRERLTAAVDGHPDLWVVGACGTLEEGAVLLAREAPDVLIVDLGLPDGSGIELIRAARRLSADTHALVVSVFGDEKNVIQAVEAGARGYLLKDAPAEVVCESVIQLISGGAPISPAIARHLLARFQEDPQPGPAGPALSKREAEVLGLVVRGFTFPEAAELLGISAHTVTTHVRRIYRKLEVRSRGEMVFEALNLGLVKPDR